MTTTNYSPRPVDTSHIKPDKTIRALAEKLARNVHERWALQRVEEGWTYGPNRDDEKKEHPGLVEYDKLPESEKDYDRVTAMETIKCILTLGYSIEPPSPDAHGATDEELASLLKTLKSLTPMSLSKLQAIWRDHDPHKWANHPEMYRYLAERIIRVGEALLCYDVVSAGLEHFPPNVDLSLLEMVPREHYLRLRQLLGLCLAQSGATSRACKVLTQLYEQGQNDGETLGILARTHKDMALRASDPAQRLAMLDAARKIYHEAFASCREHRDIDGACYNGINAASLALLCGLKPEAAALAAEVRHLCLTHVDQLREHNEEPDYWTCATLGEASLILDNWNEAQEWYKKAVQLATGQFRDISSMRRQARLLAEHLTGDAHRLDDFFPVPAVAVSAGDCFAPRRAVCALPADDWHKRLQEEASLWLKSSGAGIVYCSCFSVAELLFCEFMLKEGAEVNLVLPCSVSQFRDAFVGRRLGFNWKDRFDKVAAEVSRVFALSDRNDPEEATNIYFAYFVMDGLALLKAQRLDAQVRFLSFADHVGSAAQSEHQNLLQLWRSQNREIETLGLETGAVSDTMHSSPGSVRSSAKSIEEPSVDHVHKISAMLFADIKHYSKLDESQQLRFGQNFLPRVAEIVSLQREHIVLIKTAGDGLFLVFDDSMVAGRFALALRDKVAAINWGQFGLPKKIGIRISLDAGPVYTYKDPISRGVDVCGSYVVRAARIEPITPPGQVYASESFAAIAASQGSGEFEFEYAGRIPLPKGFGIAPVYHVRREPSG